MKIDRDQRRQDTNEEAKADFEKYVTAMDAIKERTDSEELKLVISAMSAGFCLLMAQLGRYSAENVEIVEMITKHNTMWSSSDTPRPL